MNTPVDVVGHYAKLTVTRDLMQASGRAVPPQMTAEIMALEAHAAATMSPQQIAAALQHVDIARAHLHAQVQVHVQEGERRELQQGTDALARSLTRGLVGQAEGLNAEQFQQLNATGKVTFKSNRASQAERDAGIREWTRHADPHGQGYTEREAAARLDALADAPTDAHFNKLAGSYSTSPDELRRVAKQWQTERVDYGLRKRMEAKTPDKEVTHTATDSDHRRLALANAYLAHATPTTTQDDSQQMRRDDLEDTGTRGALAKSFVALQTGQNVHDVARQVEATKQERV